MKLKRFLALAVSLAMVITMIPAFSLTASAAEEIVLFDVDNLTISGERDLADGGWTGTTSGYAAVKWNQNWGAEGTGVWGSAGTYALMFFKTSGYNGGEGSVTAAPNNAADTNGATKVTVDFNFATQVANNIYQTWEFKDVDGNTYGRLAYDRNNTVRLGISDTPVTGEGTDAVYAFRGSNVKIVTEKVADDSYTITYYVEGEVKVTETVSAANGFGSIYAYIGTYNDQWTAAGLQDLRITYELPATMVEVTASYTVDGAEVHTATKYYDSTTADSVTFDAVYSYANGTNVIYGAEATTLSENATIELAALANPDVAGYSKGSIFANSGVQYEIKSDNLVPNGDFSLGLKGWYNSAQGEAGTGNFTVNGDGTIKATTHTGSTGVGSLFRAWAIESGKKYVFTFTSDQTNTYIKVSQMASITPTGDTGNVGTGVSGTNTMIFDATEAYLVINFRWLNSNTTLGNFGLYEIAEAETVVTETVASYTIPAATVIGDTTPILATTATVTGSLGSTATGTIVWDVPESYTEATTTVNGVMTVQFGDAEAIETEVTTTVTVLEETFTVADATSNTWMAFPVDVTGEFSVEFEMTASNLDNNWIYISKDQALWGSGQIGLGWDNSGTGYFRAQPAAQTSVQFVTDNTYRFFVTGNTDTDTYDMVAYDLTTNAVVATADDYGFRTASDAINGIYITSNGENGVFSLSNVKVNANVSKTEYTFNITIDGETTSTTASYWSEADAVASVADIDGYEKTVTVDGTTITVVYSATQTLAATFVDGNGNTIKSVSEVVALGETYTVNAEEIFYIDADYNGYFYQIPETVLSADNNNLTITVLETANKYAVMEDMLVSDNEVWGMRATNSNSVFVAAGADANRGPVVDANGENNHDANHTPSTLGKSRVGFVQFPVVDVTDGQKVTANFYVREWHGNGFSNSNQTLRLAAYAVNDDSWVALTDGATYDSANAPIFEGWATPVFSQVCYNNVGYIAFDITEMMMAAKDAALETITLRLNAPYGAAYIAEREACVVGGAYAGNAAYVLVEDANLVKVTETGAAELTKNGSTMNGFAYVAASDDVRLNGADAVVIGTDAGYYYANTTMSITEATDFANTVPAGLGLAMVSGAQVRIGTTELADGAKLDALADSGIRFLATANYTDTVLNDADEFGIKVTAESSDKATYVPAVKFQDADETVFSAAITGLAESNYNRNFTAVGYAKVTMADGTVAELTTDSVTRSVYQVSAGIMKNGTADADNAAYTVDGVVKNILNAYVNQTGIRLNYATDGTVTVEEGKYTGDVFFTVTSSVADGVTTVTITPDTTWGTPAEIAEWWTDYVRVNNNNTVAKTYISNAIFVDGVLIFDFTVPTAE